MTEPVTTLKLHQALALGLSRLGVDQVFGLIGDANLFLLDYYVRRGLGRYLGCVTEGNAVLAAIGYAQSTNRTGVASVTHGPALTNCVTALVEASKGGIPLVLLAGATAPGDTQHLQWVDQRPIVEAAGAVFVDMRSAETAMADLTQAFEIATQRRCPVVFNTRADLQWDEVAQPGSMVPVTSPLPSPATADSIEEAAGMIASARRPMIIAGRGAILPEQRAAILRLARRIEAPVGTTLKASGLFRGEDFDLGIIGLLSHPTASETVLQSDCIIAFGASLSRQTTDMTNFTKGKRVVQVLADTEVTSRHTQPGLRLIGDIAATADALVALLDMAEIPGARATDADLAQRLAAEATELAAILPLGETADGTVDFIPALRRLGGALPGERLLVTDLGRFIKATWKTIPAASPLDMVFTAHFGGIGCGLGEAIGAAAGSPGKRVILISGDGGLMLSGLSDLATIVREQLDITVIVCNDGSYGAEHIQFTNRQMDPAISMIAAPDFSAVAAAIGIATTRVRDEASLDAACRLLAGQRGPLLIDLRLDPTRIFK